MVEPKEYSVDIGDVELAVSEWAGDGPPILLLHATGFHGRCWTEVVRRLPGRQIYTADLRFHGGSGSSGDVSWSLLTQDALQLIELLDLNELIGVGHSMGGFLMAGAAGTVPERFKHLILLDPVIMSPDTYEYLASDQLEIDPADHPVSKRRNNWRDAQEMYDRFVTREPFIHWQKAVLRDYCEYALKPANEEGYRELACNPLNEASIYCLQYDGGEIFELLPNISCPVDLLRAPAGEKLDFDFSKSPTWPDLIKHLPTGTESYLPHLDHFIPMRDPELVADKIKAAFQ